MRALPLFLLSALLLQDPPADPGSTLAWKLGKNDYARYACTTISFDSGGEETERGNPERLVGLFGYEIVDKTVYKPAVNDRAELPIVLGLSLPPRQLKSGQSHEWTVELDESLDCGPVTAKCTATRGPIVEFDLAPCVRLDITAKLTKSPRATAKPLRTVDKGKFEATVYFDAAKGLARKLDFFCSMTLAPVDPKGVIETVETRERLHLEEVLTVRHRAFEAEVNAAIDKGIAYLWRSFNAKENRWGAHYEHATGPTALALLTILKGSVDRKDERIARALDWLMSQPLMHTYDVGISLMALEAFYSPVDASKKTPAAAADKDIEARMEPGHARWGSSAAKWLEMNLAKGMWSYPNAADPNARDFSNTQYGVLGLYSGARCGFSPDVAVLRRLHETYLRTQQKKGPKTELTLQDPETGGGSKTMSRFIAEARGWTYYDNEDPAYGSMTAGGISSLVILDALRRRGNDGKYDAREQVRVRTAIRDGWAWLLSRWTVKGNPLHARDWLYYYLYGLERCAMLDGVARVGEHDWYGEGATYLVSNQTSAGYWHTGKYVNIYDNCFAILFLKRATVRIATGK